MKYNISKTVDRNLRSFYFTTNTKWDISGQMSGVLRLPEGGSAAIPFYGKYTDVDLTLKNVKEHDTSGKKQAEYELEAFFSVEQMPLDEKTMYINPLGIKIKDFTMSQVQ